MPRVYSSLQQRAMEHAEVPFHAPYYLLLIFRFDALLALQTYDDSRQDGSVDYMRTRTEGISDILEVSGVGWFV